MSIESRIREAVKAARADGYTIIAEDWVDHDERKCCALGAIIRRKVNGRNDDVCQDASASTLGVTKHWVKDFIRGFDGEACPAWGDDGAFEMGKRMRAEFLETAR